MVMTELELRIASAQVGALIIAALAYKHGDKRAEAVGASGVLVDAIDWESERGWLGRRDGTPLLVVKHEGDLVYAFGDYRGECEEGLFMARVLDAAGYSTNEREGYTVVTRAPGIDLRESIDRAALSEIFAEASWNAQLDGMNPEF